MRPIDADALYEGKFVETPTTWHKGWNDALDAAASAAQTIVAVEVVRCGECRYYGSYIEPSHGATVRYCKLHKGLVQITKDTFCSYGERRENHG